MKENDAVGLSSLIFNIVHGSTVDGWGVRTTVFLKGCPLRCLWCCNPEGQKKYAELKYTADDCNGCGNCVPACPKKAISMTPGRDAKALIDRELCDNCMICADSCYVGALASFSKQYTVNELFSEIERDQGYFGEDGGVTVGGGEATLYPDFTLALIEKCRKAYIHTALDTCGYVTTETGMKCLEEADLVLYDVKGLDPDTHVRGTGVSNELILKNLRYRDSLGKEIIIRLPLIPGYTDSRENIAREAELISGLKSVKRVDIIPFHKYAEIKYRQLGWPLPYVFGEDFPEAREKSVLEVFLKAGINAQIGG
ncbi:MAG: glycyl-radical enzyme activating protein [Clostridiales Family XIII bacterium]|jgi:pyruvate formate lyase activating enzyme|nr:glycyl-radical enzyme activating protein [Clostridiales Family XIII bacterium]